MLVLINKKCANCCLCVNSSPTKALDIRSGPGDYVAKSDASKCNLCGACASVCPSLALEIWGKHYSVSECLDVVELLPYHKYGSDKYKMLGRSYRLKTIEPDDELMESYKKLLKDSGLVVA